MRHLFRWLGLLTTCGLLFTLTGCFEVVPLTSLHMLTDWGKDINYVYLVTTVICGFIFVFVAGPLVYVLYKYREKEGDSHIPKQVRGNHKLEIAWTIIPVILLIFIFIPTIEVLFRHNEIPKDAFKVEAIGHQWWFEFHYPELGVTTANEIHLPEDRPIHIELKSADVIHSFWIPRFGGKVDMMPGETNHMSFRTPKAEKDGGDYYQGQCYELCGLSHALMRFQAVVHKEEEFKRWAESHNKPPVVATASEKLGEKLFTDKICMTCHTIEGTAFNGKVGPNLSDFGSRRMLGAGTLDNDRASLYKWLKDPPAVKPGSLMPNLNLTDEEIEALTAYIQNSTAKKF